ncbi:MAG: transporter substrate-binding domain-containing protein [Lactobacillaceae bacterium]|jgi:putative glutamine transport system substrate-binding protein|nr:transporter substrate-binding domain-containing protein [Lactobacillaceae bacterium]
MEKAKKKRFGIILTLLSMIFFFGSIALLAVFSANSQDTTDTLERVKNSHRMVWGVKADTKLFGLMNTKTGQIEGFDVDIAKAVTQQIADDLNITIDPVFTQVTSSTRIQLLKNGNIDAFAATATITPEREKIIDFSNSYFDAGQSLLVKKGSDIKSVADLNKKGKTVLGVVGSNSVVNIKKYAPKAKVLGLSDYAQAMTALRAGQGDALTTDNGILYGMATENKGYVVVGGTFTTEPYGLAFDNNQGPIVRAANKALKEITASGKYNKIVKKWFDGVPGINWEDLKR